MTYKTFFFNSSKTSFQIKNLLTVNIFSKYLIRKCLNPNGLFSSLGSTFIVDANSTLFLKVLSKTKTGNSVCLKESICTHNKLKNLRINSFFFTEKYLIKTKTVSLFSSSVKALNLLKTPQLTSVTQPFKGGYKVLSRGLSGFLPKSHYRVFFFKKLKYSFFVTRGTLKLTRLKYFRYFLCLFSVCKMLCIIGKATLYAFLKRRKLIPRQKSKTFVKYKSAKRSFCFKFIFLSPYIKDNVCTLKKG